MKSPWFVHAQDIRRAPPRPPHIRRSVSGCSAAIFAMAKFCAPHDGSNVKSLNAFPYLSWLLCVCARSRAVYAR